MQFRPNTVLYRKLKHSTHTGKYRAETGMENSGMDYENVTGYSSCNQE